MWLSVSHDLIRFQKPHEIKQAPCRGTSQIRACIHDLSHGRVLQVRVWELQQQNHRLLESMKEHKDKVTCIKIKSDDRECVTASTDGACIIWDLV